VAPACSRIRDRRREPASRSAKPPTAPPSSRITLHRADRRSSSLSFRAGRYRSLRFSNLNAERHKSVAVINEPESVPSPPTTELKHLTGKPSPNPRIARELSRRQGDPYYPIPRPRQPRTLRPLPQLGPNANRTSPSSAARPIQVPQHGPGRRRRPRRASNTSPPMQTLLPANKSLKLFFRGAAPLRRVSGDISSAGTSAFFPS